MIQHIESPEGTPHAWDPYGEGDDLWADVTELAEAVMTSSSAPDGFVQGELPVGERRARVFAGVGRGDRTGPRTVVVVFPPEARPAPGEGELRRRFKLTPREAEVALLLAARRSNKEIARQLSISPKTAARHTQKVLAKLDTRSRRDVADVLGWSPRGNPTRARRRRARTAWTG